MIFTFSTQVTLTFDLKFAPQLLMSSVMFPTNVMFVRLSDFK